MTKRKVALLTGSYTPDICGVGDYTKQIYENIECLEKNFLIELIVAKDWSIKGLFRLIKQIKNNYEIVHMQYPTEGYGYSLYPIILLAFLKSTKRIITLHEYSQRTLKAKLATNIFFYFTDFIIFTTDYEREVVIEKFKFVKSKSKVINIGSNIESPVEKINWKNRDFDVAYFGHIRPQKGIEEFKLICKELLLINSKVKLSLVGQLQIRFEDYYKKNVKDSSYISILNQRDEIVSKILQNTKILLLPFPDGISMRRGSFLAGIENDCVIVSFNGKYSDSLSTLAILFNPNTSFKIIAEEINKLLFENEFKKDLKMSIDSFKNKIKWSTIAQAHLEIYEA